MTRRLATVSFLTLLLIGLVTRPARAQVNNPAVQTLQDLSAVHVLVEDLDAPAELIGLTGAAIQTDVELKLRLAGIRVMTEEEQLKVPGMPELYVDVSLAKDAIAYCIRIELKQNVSLSRNGQSAVAVTTWETGGMGLNSDAQGIRGHVKDNVDEFLNAWLSVNPKT